MNYEFKEKNFSEELNAFDNSQANISSLFRLYLESRTINNPELMQYSLKYINAIQELERFRIENLTKYFVEVVNYKVNAFRTLNIAKSKQMKCKRKMVKI